MSKPADARYYIVNKDTTEDGKALAINFNGYEAPLSVTEFERLPTQIWSVRDLTGIYIGLQWIEYQDTTIPIGIDGNGNLAAFETSVSERKQWHVRGSEDGIYTIQDEYNRGFWGLKKVAVGERIAGSINERHYWRLIPVPIPPVTASPPASQCTTM